MYPFLLNMWVMNRIDETFLQAQITLKRLTQEEYGMIIATPRLPK